MLDSVLAAEEQESDPSRCWLALETDRFADGDSCLGFHGLDHRECVRSRPQRRSVNVASTADSSSRMTGARLRHVRRPGRPAAPRACTGSPRCSRRVRLSLRRASCGPWLTRLDHQQDGCGDAEHDPDPGGGRAAPHRQQDQHQHHDSEHAEQRAADVASLHARGTAGRRQAGSPQYRGMVRAGLAAARRQPSFGSGRLPRLVAAPASGSGRSRRPSRPGRAARRRVSTPFIRIEKATGRRAGLAVARERADAVDRAGLRRHLPWAAVPRIRSRGCPSCRRSGSDVRNGLPSASSEPCRAGAGRPLSARPCSFGSARSR